MTHRLTAVLLLLVAPFAAQAAEFRTQHREAITWQQGMEMSFENLLGAATVVGGSGNQIVFEVEVVADARDAAAAEALAKSVSVRREQRGRSTDVWVEYPLRQHDEFRFSDDSRWSGNTNTTYRGERVRVSSRSGADVHAIVRITVPAGAKLAVTNHVGGLTAENVRGELALRTSSGRIESAKGAGALALHSGSGRVTVTDQEGSVNARTGSGSVTLNGIAGVVDAHTGSGSIRAEQVAGETVKLRTGSGSIRIDDVSGALNAGTGSGSVRVGRLTSGADFTVSTGSGSVQVDGDLARVTSMRISTGSGSVTVNSAGVPNVKFLASAGSGSVSVDVPNMSNVSARRNRVEATFGTGEGEARLTTGSGSIRFNAGK